MATEITMPKLSDTMEEGILISWKKSLGDKVNRGDIIAEVETDKATMELEAFASGFLLETHAKPGDVVAVGTVIGIIGAESDKPTPGNVSSRPEKDEMVQKVVKKSSIITVSEKEQYHEKPAVVSKTDQEGNGELTARAPKGVPGEKDGGGVQKASPMVRRMARDKGVELSLVPGTGPEGRILKEDLEKFLVQKEEKQPDVNVPDTAKAPGTAPPRRTSLEGGSEQLSRMRAAIARTVTESWRTIPHFTVTMDIDMGAAEAIHKGFKEAGESVTLNDFVIKAVATALVRFPRLNASWADDRIEIHPEINVGVAVNVADGLIVPVVRDCGNISLREVARQSHEMVERARTGKIAQGDMADGTFTVSNMGMLGVDGFTAIILPPQVGILAIGTVTDAAVVRNGHIAVARMIKAVLSADHRVVDGAYGGGFMKELKEILENPVRLLV